MDEKSLVDATQLLDKTLLRISSQSLVSGSEMTDLLLDIRLFLMTICETAKEQV